MPRKKFTPTEVEKVAPVAADMPEANLFEMEPVVSETVESLKYFPEHRDLVVKFKQRGSVYVYHDVDPGLAAAMHGDHPWSRFGAIVREHPYERVR